MVPAASPEINLLKASASLDSANKQTLRKDTLGKDRIQGNSKRQQISLLSHARVKWDHILDRNSLLSCYEWN